MQQGDLFGPVEPIAPPRYPAVPGFKEPTTSKDAAASMKSRSKILAMKVLAKLKRRPMTPDEVASALGDSVLSIRPRITELAAKGQIARTGERRANASGRKAHVYRIARVKS